MIWGLKTHDPISQPPTTLFRFGEAGADYVEVGRLKVGSQDIEADALAMSPQGALVAFWLTGGGSQLISVNPADAVATPIGPVLPNRNLRGATFLLSGRLIAFDSNAAELIEVDPASGQVIRTLTQVPPWTSGNWGSGSDLTQAPDGSCLFADVDRVFRVDVHNGSLTPLLTDSTPLDDGSPIYCAGLACSAEASPDTTVFAYDVTMDDDIYSYQPEAGWQRTQLLRKIVASYNAGRGDLAALPAAKVELTGFRLTESTATLEAVCRGGVSAWVEFTDDLASPNWQTVPGTMTQIPTSEGSIATPKTWTDLPVTAQHRFFRLTSGVKGWVLINSNGPAGGGIAAYDSDRQVAVMFACVGSYPSDTWEFDGTTWRQVAVSGPHGRDSSGKMVYDPLKKRMIMQGGWWPDDNDRWTWEYRVTGPGPDDRQWVNLVQTDCAYRGAPCLAYDGKRHTVLSFGGNHWQSFYNDAWRFDSGTDTWTWLQNWGPGRFAAGMVYDSARDKFVLFGGTGRWWSGDTEQGRGNTCEFDPKTDTWAEVLPQGAPGAPGPRWFPAMVFDPVAGVTLLKGGGRVSDGYTYTDTWEWNGTAWTEIPARPGEPTGGVMWFDTALQKVVLFSAPNTYVYHR